MSEILYLENIRRIYSKNIILFGASKGGEKMLHFLAEKGVDVKYFCDNNEKKWGTMFINHTIISPQQIKDIDNHLVIISSVYIKEITEQLVTNGIKRENIVSSLSVQIGFTYEIFRNPQKLSFNKKNMLMSELYFSKHDQSYLYDTSLTIERLVAMLAQSRKPLFIYSTGKVATNSIYNGIDSEKFYPMHFHDLYMLFQNNSLSFELWHELLNYYKENGEKIKIVCGIREPISKGISAFFQNLDVTQGLNIDFKKNFFENILEGLMIEQKENAFVRDYPSYLLNNFKYGNGFDWFDLELKKYFGIDIYAIGFDREKGYSVYSNEYVDVFVYKFEKLNQIGKSLAVFLGDSKFEVIHSNENIHKKYFLLYQECIEKIKIPQNVLNFYYKDNFAMDFFYTEEEKETLKEKWGGKQKYF